MNNIKITYNQKCDIIHIVGEGDMDCFTQLWKDLEVNLAEYYLGPLPLMAKLSRSYLGFDATFDKETMIITIGGIELEALNDMLNFAGYSSIGESEYDLDITIK